MPWSANGLVDIFVQSWNPGSMAHAMDAFWQPRLAQHADQNTSLRCPISMRLCERTMWAVLGMKQALALRTAYERSHSVHHAAVLVMRHDVYWRSPLPPLRADDRHIRLWLGFDCEVNYCWAGPNARSACQGRYISNRTAPPPWMELKHSRSSYFGMPASRCTERGGGTLAQLALCENTVLLDWWAVMSADLADRLGAELFESFGRYSQLVQTVLGLNVSAPHQYWGLFFFFVNRLRSHCQVGHVMLHGLDFTLGRFVPAGVDARSTCKYGSNETWRPLWEPPPHQCRHDKIPGYVTMCPGVPDRPIEYSCG